ncbi:hypothetical protein HOW07_01760 [Plantibacter sp. MCCC 1A11337]|uniref:hypothetical protein n=1 Tax=Plantibacter sp. MCCC 1A11337 TaxID=2736644 RepID=UPI00158151B6|nr:hypothetical protein [Plantibacter sp. MCCC 1A11337]NUJ86737.1 hypothetical protein [Plantibacter sp. MCCC 1A11337]
MSTTVTVPLKACQAPVRHPRRHRAGAHTPLQVVAGHGSGVAVFLCHLPILAALAG